MMAATRAVCRHCCLPSTLVGRCCLNKLSAACGAAPATMSAVLGAASNCTASSAADLLMATCAKTGKG